MNTHQGSTAQILIPIAPGENVPSSHKIIDSYTPEEKAVVRRYYGKQTYGAIASMIGRTPESVKARARKMGLCQTNGSIVHPDDERHVARWRSEAFTPKHDDNPYRLGDDEE